jgi:hypothetical protein
MTVPTKAIHRAGSMTVSLNLELGGAIAVPRTGQVGIHKGHADNCFADSLAIFKELGFPKLICPVFAVLLNQVKNLKPREPG